MTLVDTDVLIWLLRGYPRALSAIKNAESPAISVIGEMELIQGARDKHDLRKIRQAISDLRLLSLPLTGSVGNAAAELLATYALSHGLRLTDALIAATALERKASVLTGNVKHFSFVPGLELRAFRP